MDRQAKPLLHIVHQNLCHSELPDESQSAVWAGLGSVGPELREREREDTAALKTGSGSGRAGQGQGWAFALKYWPAMGQERGRQWPGAHWREPL